VGPCQTSVPRTDLSQPGSVLYNIDSYQIRRTYHQQLKAKLKTLPAVGSRLGSASRGHSYASFSRRSRGRIYQRIFSSAQWHAQRPESRSSATRFTKEAKRGVIFGSPAYRQSATGANACSPIEIECTYQLGTTVGEHFSSFP
jgi:hypothetical protein